VNTPLQLTTRGAVEIPSESAESASLPALPEATARSAADAENALTGKEGQVLGDAGKMRAHAAQDFVVANPLEPAAVDYPGLLREALVSRAEILREDANVAAAQKGITIARSVLLPSVSLGYSYTLNPNASAFGGQKQSGQAVLTVNVPLFDAGEARGRVRTARAQVAAAETNRRTQVDAVTLEVRQAILNLQQAQGETAATRQALALADEAYRLARLRYSAGVTKQSGVSPLIELSDAQKTLSAAQSDYVNALYDYNNDRSALDKAVGRYSYTPVGPGYVAPIVVH
jgi:outer membrane protein TolC